MRFPLFCAFLLLSQCATQIKSASTNTNSTTDAHKTLEAAVGPKYTQVLNESKTYLLAVEERDIGIEMNRYVVIEIVSQKIIQKGNFHPGYIKWRNNTSLEVLSVPGMIPEGKDLSDYIKIIQLPSSK